jgi:hypothetical protein
MMEGSIHVLDVGGGTLHVVFSSATDTRIGKHAVSGDKGVEHFIAQTLRCELKSGDMDLLTSGKAIKVAITGESYTTYFSK